LIEDEPRRGNGACFCNAFFGRRHHTLLVIIIISLFWHFDFKSHRIADDLVSNERITLETGFKELRNTDHIRIDQQN
jgi:hypothetical protein